MTTEPDTSDQDDTQKSGDSASGGDGSGDVERDPGGDRREEGPKTPSPEEIQKDLQEFFKDRFGETNVFFSPVGAAPSPPTDEVEDAEELRHRRSEALDFSMKPAEVKAHLDRFVIGQEQAKRTLAVAVCDHYNHARRAHEGATDDIDYVKQNVILLGPTGVGKTYLIRTLAQLLGVPFVKADITKFSETGYVGMDVDELVRELVRVADGDIELAEYGIIFLDEIDKIAAAQNSTGRDVSGRGVQTGLLKLLEDTDVPARSPNDISAQFQELMQSRSGAVARRMINTKHILFVVSGAFSGLDEIVEKRLSAQRVGFGAKQPATTEPRTELVLGEVATKDFVDYGFEPEFIGRLPIRVALSGLTEDDLFEILATSEGSILRQHVESFRGYSIDVAFDDGALRAVAALAKDEETGARGLMTILEAALRDFKFELPSQRHIERFVVTSELIADPRSALDRLIADPSSVEREFALLEVRRFEREFARRHGVRLELDEAASTMAGAIAEEMSLDVVEYLEQVFDDHTEFLVKLREETGRESFPVTPQILSRPGDGVELWLADREPGTEETHGSTSGVS